MDSRSVLLQKIENTLTDLKLNEQHKTEKIKVLLSSIRQLDVIYATISPQVREIFTEFNNKFPEDKLVSSSINETNRFDNALAQSAMRGLADCLKELLLAGANINSRTEQGKTPLMFAATRGHLQCVNLLIEKKADLDCKDASLNRHTALISAVSGDHDECVDALIANGANLEVECSLGQTAIFSAVYNSNIKNLKALIHAGADINHRGKYNDTVMHHVQSSSLECINVLIKAGANLTVINSKKMNPLDTIIEQGSYTKPNQLAITRLLLEKNVPILNPDRLLNFLLRDGQNNSDVLISLEILCKNPSGLSSENVEKAQNYLIKLKQLDQMERQKIAEAMDEGLNFKYPEVLIKEISNYDLSLDRLSFFRSNEIDEQRELMKASQESELLDIKSIFKK